nr:hypothetical protein Iba_chr04eCG6480 [Ipomoea batatas]
MQKVPKLGKLTGKDEMVYIDKSLRDKDIKSFGITPSEKNAYSIETSSQKRNPNPNRKKLASSPTKPEFTPLTPQPERNDNVSGPLPPPHGGQLRAKWQLLFLVDNDVENGQAPAYEGTNDVTIRRKQ